MEVLVRTIKQKKEIKGIKIGQEEKLSLLTDHMFSYVENSKNYTHTHSAKLQDKKINIQKPVASLYSNSEWPKQEIKRKTAFIIHQKE